MDLYDRVLTDFHQIYAFRRRPQKLKNYLSRNVGSILCLGQPGNWYLRLEHDPGDGRERSNPAMLLCCAERFVRLGSLYAVDDRGAERPDGDDPEEKAATRDVPDAYFSVRNRCRGPGHDRLDAGYVAYLGEHGRFYVYDCIHVVLYLVALNVEELATYGVVRCEFSHRHGRADPARLRAVEPYYGKPRPGSEITVAFRSLNGAIEERVTLHRLPNGDVPLYTPGYGLSILRLVSDVRELRRAWPLSILTGLDFQSWKDAVGAKLCTPWYPLGVTGMPKLTEGTPRPSRAGSDDTPKRSSTSLCTPFTEFQAEALIVVDSLSAVYAVTMHGSHMVCRVADTLCEFFRIGVLKIVFPGRRFESTLDQRCRCEYPGRCPHGNDAAIEAINNIMKLSGLPDPRHGRDEVDDHYRWMLRHRRGRAVDPWDHTDKNAVLLYRNDFGTTHSATAWVIPRTESWGPDEGSRPPTASPLSAGLGGVEELFSWKRTAFRNAGDERETLWLREVPCPVPVPEQSSVSHMRGYVQNKRLLGYTGMCLDLPSICMVRPYSVFPRDPGSGNEEWDDAT
uniref:Gp142 n=1 Tax=Caviid herpesvirus 2 str. CIDMTR TaxID=1415526 RepID=U6HC82_9BETA|nr:gp142 [Caviid herpesvirus 2 str. CIDMTR]